MCNIYETNTRQILEELSSELKFLVNDMRVIECVISELIAKSDSDLRTKHVISLQKLDQIIQTMEALSNFTMNVSKTNLSVSEFQREIKQINLESLRMRIGMRFGISKIDKIGTGEDQIEFF